MLKQFLHKMLSVLMALLLLLSTVSFTVEKHFCGDRLIDVALFSDVEKCKMEAFEKEQEQVSKTSCCKDTRDVIEGQDLLNYKSIDDLDLDQQQWLFGFTIGYLSLFDTLPKPNNPHKHYKPPNLIVDIQMLDQVYLI